MKVDPSRRTNSNRTEGRRFAAIVAAIGMISLLASGAVALEVGTLPAGTSIEVSIDAPSDGAEFLVPAGGTADVTVEGTASVAEGVAVKDTTLVYTVDTSGSMSLDAGVDCTGDASTDDRLACAKEAIGIANTAAADPFSAIGLTGLASYESAATTHNVDLGGTALLVAPDHDGNGNTIHDVEEVADGLTLGFQTNFAAGLQAAVDLIEDPANANPVNVIIFLSDADTTSVMVGPDVSTVAIPPNTTIHAFGMGVGPDCAFDGGTGSLDDIAAMSTAGTGTCEVVDDMSVLADFIAASVGSTLDSLEISVDGAPATTIPAADIDTPLPADGPVGVNYATLVTGLAPGDHEICVTATGTDAGGSGSVTDCVDIRVIVEVDLDIKPGSDPNSINTQSNGVIPVGLFGSADFDVSDVDVSTLEFAGAAPAHDLTSPSVLAKHLEDLDGDGFDDLVTHYRVQDTTLAPGDTEACLTGETTSGIAFVGCDAVRIVK